jgi:hypothetical protein
MEIPKVEKAVELSPLQAAIKLAYAELVRRQDAAWYAVKQS